MKKMMMIFAMLMAMASVSFAGTKEGYIGQIYSALTSHAVGVNIAFQVDGAGWFEVPSSATNPNIQQNFLATLYLAKSNGYKVYVGYNDTPGVGNVNHWYLATSIYIDRN